jgi:hypothetical protein
MGLCTDIAESILTDFAELSSLEFSTERADHFTSSMYSGLPGSYLSMIE